MHITVSSFYFIVRDLHPVTYEVHTFTVMGLFYVPFHNHVAKLLVKLCGATDAPGLLAGD